MPLDVAPLQITHHPTQRVDFAPPKLNIPGAGNTNDGLTDLIELLKNFTGIDLSNPQTWPIIGSLIEILTGIEDGDLNDLGTWVNNIMESIEAAATMFGQAFLKLSIVQDILEVITGVEDGDTDDLGTWVNNVVYDIRETIDNIVRGLLGWVGNGFSGDDSAQALIDNAATVASLAANVQDLINNQNNQAVGGRTASIDLTALPASSALPSNLQVTYEGTGLGRLVIGPNNQGAIWDAVNGASVTCHYLFGDVETQTDYQKAGAAFGSAPEWFNSSAKGRNMIRVRCNSAKTSYVFVEFNRFSFDLGYVVAGAKTVIKTVTNFIFKPNTVYWLSAGTIGVGNQRVYQVWENNTVILEWPETGTTSMMGAGYRWTGGSASAYSSAFGTSRPARILAIAGSDNYPAEVVGSGAQMSRTASGGFTFAAGRHAFPTDFFNNPGPSTPDITHLNNTWKVSVKGWYRIEAHLRTNPLADWPNHFMLFIRKNGTQDIKAIGADAGSSTGQPWVIDGGGDVYLDAGEYFGLAYESSAAVGGFDGEAVGAESWISIVNVSTQMNRSAAA